MKIIEILINFKNFILYKPKNKIFLVFNFLNFFRLWNSFEIKFWEKCLIIFENFKKILRKYLIILRKSWDNLCNFWEKFNKFCKKYWNVKKNFCKTFWKMFEILTNIWALVYNPFRPKIIIFLRNRRRWFRIWSWFVQYCSSFGDIGILPPSGICTRSTKTSWSCTPWSKCFIQMFFNNYESYEGYEGFEGLYGFQRVYVN